MKTSSRRLIIHKRRRTCNNQPRRVLRYSLFFLFLFSLSLSLSLFSRHYENLIHHTFALVWNNKMFERSRSSNRLGRSQIMPNRVVDCAMVFRRLWAILCRVIKINRNDTTCHLWWYRTVRRVLSFEPLIELCSYLIAS